MSDGPHRSLNMTRSWKRAAERSDKRSYSSEEVSESFVGALEKDCRREINPSFIDTAWRIFSDPEPSLFVAKISDQLEALRRQAGSGIGRSVLDQAIFGAERGKTGREGLVEAMKNALADRSAKAIRQIQEHYCRESSNRHLVVLATKSPRKRRPQAEAVRDMCRVHAAPHEHSRRWTDRTRRNLCLGKPRHQKLR